MKIKQLREIIKDEPDDVEIVNKIEDDAGHLLLCVVTSASKDVAIFRGNDIEEFGYAAKIKKEEVGQKKKLVLILNT